MAKQPNRGDVIRRVTEVPDKYSAGTPQIAIIRPATPKSAQPSSGPSNNNGGKSK